MWYRVKKNIAFGYATKENLCAKRQSNGAISLHKSAKDPLAKALYQAYQQLHDADSRVQWVVHHDDNHLQIYKLEDGALEGPVNDLSIEIRVEQLIDDAAAQQIITYYRLIQNKLNIYADVDVLQSDCPSQSYDLSRSEGEGALPDDKHLKGIIEAFKQLPSGKTAINWVLIDKAGDYSFNSLDALLPKVEAAEQENKQVQQKLPEAMALAAPQQQQSLAVPRRRLAAKQDQAVAAAAETTPNDQYDFVFYYANGKMVFAQNVAYNSEVLKAPSQVAQIILRTVASNFHTQLHTPLQMKALEFTNDTFSSHQRRQSIKAPYVLIIQGSDVYFSAHMQVQARDGQAFPCEVRKLVSLEALGLGAASGAIEQLVMAAKKQITSQVSTAASASRAGAKAGLAGSSSNAAAVASAQEQVQPVGNGTKPEPGSQLKP